MWEERPGTSPLIRTLWQAEVEEADTYLTAGSEYWGLSFIRHADSTLAAVLAGPSLQARVVDGILGERYWGVELAAHVAIPGKGQLDTFAKQTRCRQNFALP